MGKFSRQKGKRIERFLVDTLKEFGLNAERVPFSGAGREKGDVKVEIPGTRRSDNFNDAHFWYYEVKARKSEFDKLIYFVREILGTEHTCLYVKLGKKSCYVTFNPFLIRPLNALKKDTPKTLELHLDKEYGYLDSVLKKLFTYEKWICGCDCLALKGDRLPLTYISYATTIGNNDTGTQISSTGDTDT